MIVNNKNNPALERLEKDKNKLIPLQYRIEWQLLSSKQKRLSKE